MKTIFSTLLAGSLLTQPLHAQSFLNGEEFDALTRGKTYYFSHNGQPYGGEEYLENRRVRWSRLDGNCMEGHWYQAGDLICFIYQDELGQTESAPQCWAIKATPSGLNILFENDPTGTQLYEVEQSDEPLHCIGPDWGM